MPWPVGLVWAALAVTVALSVYLWSRLRSEIRNSRRDLEKQATALAAFNSLAARLESLEVQLQQIKNQRSGYLEWVSSSESLNLNRRGQVLRLHGRGDSVPAIADALRMGQGEVRLMIKVHELSRNYLKTDAGS